MADSATIITRKYVLIPERSDSALWENRVREYIVSDLESRIHFYEDQLEHSKKKEVKDKAESRLESLNAELVEFTENMEITQKVINNYTYGLVRTAMKEESARKNYIVEYVRMVLTAEHAYKLDPKERGKRINEILKYAYRQKGSSKGSLFDETEIGNILGGYGVAFNQMLTQKIKDCCNRGALEGKESFPFFKADSPFTVAKTAMSFTSNYDSYEELCEHTKDCNLYFNYGGNGNPHIVRFKIDLGHGKKRYDTLDMLLKIYSGEYDFCGSTIQISKNKIILNLSIKIPKEDKQLDENTVVGVHFGMSLPAMCAVNNNDFAQLAIGDEKSFLRKKVQFQSQYQQLQAALCTTSGGHGRKKKLQALNRLHKAERNFTKTYCHAISKDIVDFALEHKAKYINIENMPGYNEEPFAKRNSCASIIVNDVTYKAAHYNMEVRLINPYLNEKVCSICKKPGELNVNHEFVCSDPECKSHTMYKKGLTCDFNGGRNASQSTLFMPSGKVTKKSFDDAVDYYGYLREYKSNNIDIAEDN